MTRAYLAALVLAGCSADDIPPEASAAACPPPNRVVDTRCLEPGVADDGCPAGTLGQPDGSCRPAGMLPEDCAMGFVHDGDVGCEAILPPEPCPPGLMAVPGETTCRAVMDCGSGKWGGIPLDATTEYVDQSFAGVSDGSSDAPWKTIAEGIYAALPGSLVAVAAGSYVGPVDIAGTAVRLHGVCPDRVEIVGSEPAEFALFVFAANGSEVRGLAVRGGENGIAVISDYVLLDRLWVHDNAGRGLEVDDSQAVTLRDALFERNEMGVFVAGAELDVEATAVRDGQPDALGTGGRGLHVRRSLDGAAAHGRVRGSLFERNREFGVVVFGAQLTMHGTVVRDTAVGAPADVGMGIHHAVAAGAAAESTISGSLVERNHEYGVYGQGADVTLEATVVRDTVPGTDVYGRGVGITNDPESGTLGRATVRRSLVERNLGVGAFFHNADVAAESIVVRDTMLDGDSESRGIGVQVVDATVAAATIRGSLVERHREIGIFVGGAAATLEATLVRNVDPNAYGSFGRGIEIQSAPGIEPSVRACRIETTHEAGLFLAGQGQVEDTHIATTRSSDRGRGDGVVVFHSWRYDEVVSALLDRVRIEDSERAGLATFGWSTSLHETAIGCSAFALNVERYEGVDGSLTDLGGNVCGCPVAEGPCAAKSAGIEPPEAVPPSR